MKPKKVYLEKLPFGKDDKLGTKMINQSRIEICNHLFSNDANKDKSGYLTDEDIALVEKLTMKKIHCSVESGEYFYRLV